MEQNILKITKSWLNDKIGPFIFCIKIKAEKNKYSSNQKVFYRQQT